ncbi:MAG: hypothetical protein V3R77_09310 [Candidatus Binatia bacterium]
MSTSSRALSGAAIASRASEPIALPRVLAACGKLAVIGLLVLLGTTGAGCGVQGPPRPVEDTAALAPDDFVARNAEGGVFLKWTRPQEAVDGEPLYDLAGFQIERRRPTERRFEVVDRILTSDTDRLRPQRTFRYTDTTAQPPGLFEYRIRAWLNDGQRGIPTPTLVVDTTIPPLKD